MAGDWHSRKAILLAAWGVVLGTLTAAAGAEPVAARTGKLDRAAEALPPGAILRLGSSRLRTGAQIGGMAFAPDGKLLAACAADGVVRLWDAGTGNEVRVFRAHPWGGAGIAFSPDGNLLAIGSTNGTTSLWDVSAGKELRRLKHPAGVAALAFAPTARPRRDQEASALLLAVGDVNGGLGLWNAATGELLSQVQAHAQAVWVWSVAFAPDGKTVATASFDDTLSLWDVATGKQIHAIRGERNGFTAVGFGADASVVLSGGHDGRVRFHDLETKRVQRHLGAARPGFTSFGLSADGKTMITGAEGGEVLRVWDVTKDRELRQITGLSGPPHHLVLSRDGKTAASASFTGQRIQLWDVAAGKELFPADGHVGVLTDVWLPPGGQTAVTASTDRTVRVWDLATGKTLHRFDGAENQYMRAAVSANGRVVALGGSADTIRLYDLAAGKPVGAIPVGPGGVSVLALAPDAATLVGVSPRDHSIGVWDVATGRETGRLRGHAASTFALAVSSDGKRLVSGSQDSTVRVWDLAVGKELHQFRADTPLSSVAFSPDCKAVAAGGNGRALVWDAITGEERASLGGHQGRVQCVAFSADGRLLATGGIDCTLAVWELASGKPLAPPSTHRDICNALAFAPDRRRGDLLLSGSFDTSALVWELTPSPKGGEARERAEKQLDALWDNLAGEAGDARWAIRVMAQRPKAVAFLKDRLKGKAPDGTAARIRQWITDLDDDNFAVRQSASRELAKAGVAAVPALRAALEAGPSPEVRWRVETLLKTLASPPSETMTRELLRTIRAVEVLEEIGTPEAQEVLRAVAQGLSERPAREAREALERLKERADRR
jgi:WD40 repeat protein